MVERRNGQSHCVRSAGGCFQTRVIQHLVLTHSTGEAACLSRAFDLQRRHAQQLRAHEESHVIVNGFSFNSRERILHSDRIAKPWNNCVFAVLSKCCRASFVHCSYLSIPIPANKSQFTCLPPSDWPACMPNAAASCSD